MSRSIFSSKSSKNRGNDRPARSILDVKILDKDAEVSRHDLSESLTQSHRSRSVTALSRQQSTSALSCSASSSSYSSGSSETHYAAVPVPPSSRLETDELEQVAAFYRSHRTALFVGQCLVGLYFTETELADGGRVSRPRRQDWKLTVTGIPVLILNRGDVKSRDKRQVQIYVAERGSGLPLWSDIIDGLSGYCADEKTFHTLYLSSNHRKMAGLSFDCPVAAQEFYTRIEPVINNPENISLTKPKSKSSSSFFRRNRSKSVGRALSTASSAQNSRNNGTLERFWTDSNAYGSSKGFRVPSKSDISQPCMFQHIASVNTYNCDEFPSTLATILPSDLQSTSDGNSVHYSSPEPLHSGDRSPIGSLSDVRHHPTTTTQNHCSTGVDSSLSSASNFSY